MLALQIFIFEKKEGISVYKTSFKVSLFLIILLLPYTVLFAAGLGKLSLTSALGQPLSAEIDIVTTNKDEIPSLKASIASRDAFAQAGINYETFFQPLRFPSNRELTVILTLSSVLLKRLMILS